MNDEVSNPPPDQKSRKRRNIFRTTGHAMEIFKTTSPLQFLRKLQAEDNSITFYSKALLQNKEFQMYIEPEHLEKVTAKLEQIGIGMQAVYLVGGTKLALRNIPRTMTDSEIQQLLDDNWNAGNIQRLEIMKPYDTTSAFENIGRGNIFVDADFMEAGSEVSKALQTDGVFALHTDGLTPIYIRTPKADYEYWQNRQKRYSVQIPHTQNVRRDRSYASVNRSSARPPQNQSGDSSNLPDWFAGYRAKIHASTLATRELHKENEKRIQEINRLNNGLQAACSDIASLREDVRRLEDSNRTLASQVHNLTLQMTSNVNLTNPTNPQSPPTHTRPPTQISQDNTSPQITQNTQQLNQQTDTAIQSLPPTMIPTTIIPSPQIFSTPVRQPSAPMSSPQILASPPPKRQYVQQSPVFFPHNHGVQGITQEAYNNMINQQQGLMTHGQAMANQFAMNHFITNQ